MSKESFIRILLTFSISNINYLQDRLLIKLNPLANPEEVETYIEREYEMQVISAKLTAENFLLTSFPFYSVLVAEFVFSLFICMITFAFISISNPLKLLQKKVGKFDILKKLGVRTNRIILISALELLISCILPGLILGWMIGYGLIRLTIWVFFGLYYFILPFKFTFPVSALVTAFIIVPVVYYTIFFVTMKYNFQKYRPRNLE